MTFVHECSMVTRSVASICNALTSESFDRESSFFGVQVHYSGIQVSFICQGHPVKVKVTGAKKCLRCKPFQSEADDSLQSPSYVHIVLYVRNDSVGRWWHIWGGGPRGGAKKCICVSCLRVFSLVCLQLKGNLVMFVKI